MNHWIMWLARLVAAVLVAVLYRLFGLAAVGIAVSLALAWVGYHRVHYGYWPD